MRRVLLLVSLFAGAIAVVGTALAAVGAPSPTTPSTTTLAAGVIGLQDTPEAALAQDQRIGGVRDPFKPLIDPSDPLASTTTLPDTSSTTSTTSGGGTSSTTSSSTSSTTSTTGFVPGTVTVALIEIRTVGGELQATVEVDGVNYVVEEGEAFATDFTVVTLFTNRAVLTFQGRTFELTVGQAILK
jgi:hypothetical protein